MGNAQEAVKTLEKRGLRVQGLHGPDGWRYQIKSRTGIEYQISNEDLLLLQSTSKLNWSGVVEIVSKSHI
jgi:hypothetical protein